MHVMMYQTLDCSVGKVLTYGFHSKLFGGFEISVRCHTPSTTVTNVPAMLTKELLTSPIVQKDSFLWLDMIPFAG